MTELSTQSVKLLEMTRDILSGPDKWTKGTFARDTTGEVADPSGPNAACFCIGGALLRARDIRIEQVNKLVPKDAYSEVWDQYDNAFNETVFFLSALAGSASVAAFNDDKGTTFADVDNLLDLALERAGEAVVV